MYYSTNGSTPIQLTNVQVPFYTSGHPLATDRKDMYPEDGWMLAFRDFGTPTDAPALPFFALYNRYRGTLRVMFYNAPNIAYTSYRVDLSFRDSASTGALLTFTDPDKSTIDEYDRTKTESFMARVAQFRGWIYADFTVFGYDPATSPNTKFRIDVSGVDESRLCLKSTLFTLSEVLDRANPSSSRPLTASSALAAFNQGQKFYNSVADAKKALQAKVNSTTSNPWWKSKVQAVLGSQLATLAPVIGGLMGFVTSFIGGSNTPTAREPMNFEGSLEMDGTFSLTRQIIAADFALFPGAAAPDFYRPVRTIPWGVFNLTTRPQVRAIAWQDYCPDDGYGTVYSCLRDYEFRLQPLSYLLNPGAGLTIKSIRAAFTHYGVAPTAFTDVTSLWGGYFEDVQYVPYYYVRNQWGAWPNQVALEIVLQTSAPTRYADREFVVYKTFSGYFNLEVP